MKYSNKQSKSYVNDAALEYVAQLQQGDKKERKQASEKLCQSVTPYVIFLARKYWQPNYPFEIRDLVNSGIVGILEAAYKFDFNYRNTFLTFATSYIIKQFDILLQHQYSSWSLPYNARVDFAKIMNRVNAGENIEKVCAEMRISQDIYWGYLKILGTISLDNYFDDDNEDDREVRYRIPDRRINVSKEAVDHVFTAEFWGYLYDRYPEKYINALKYYYSGLTMQEVADIIGVTKQRVDQIVKKLLKELQTDENMRYFKEAV